MSISLSTIKPKSSSGEKISQSESRDSEDRDSGRKSERYVFRLSSAVDAEEFRHSEINIIDDKRKVEASKDIIISRLRDKFMMVVATREKIAEAKQDIEEDLEWTAEQRQREDGEYFYKSNIEKQKDLQVFDDEKKIEEYILAKTLEAVHVRLCYSKMKADMIVLQENAILEAFDEPNYLISKAACKWQKRQYVRALAVRVRATVKEKKGYQRYADLVLSQAKAPKEEIGLYDSSHHAWANRVASDMLVLVELKNILAAAKATKDSVKIIKARWNYCRAEAILAADQAALRAVR